MAKQWQILKGESCPNCGDDIEVLSFNKSEPYLSDCDEVRCAAKCGFISAISLTEDGELWLQYGNLDEL